MLTTWKGLESSVQLFHKDTNPINKGATQRLLFLTPSFWGVGFQDMNVEGMLTFRIAIIMFMF